MYIMAEEMKRKRSRTLGKFTRTYNTLVKLLDQEGSNRSVVDPQFESLKTIWEALEDTHEDYLANADAAVSDDAVEAAYLDEPGERYTTAVVRYSEYLKSQDESKQKSEESKVKGDRLYEDERRKRETKELKEEEELRAKEELKVKFQSLTLEVKTDVDSFKNIAGSLKNSLEEASDQVKRGEWTKVETEFQSLREKLRKCVGMDQSVDAADSEETKEKFREAETAFTEFQNWMLPQLKDVPNTSGGSSSTMSSAKKEAVRLPRFEGAEKSSPFLHFPIWKDQWEKMIEEYPEKWQSQVLLDHLDETAKSKLIGCETNYEEAMKTLTAFFGDRTKVISCVQRQVNGMRTIVPGDYEGLLQFSVLIHNNYTRLKNIGAEHELSNSQAMVAILKKFPRDVTERWSDFLAGKTEDQKIKPFPVFVDWLKSRKETWDLMVTTTTEGTRAKKDGGGNFYGDAEKKEKTCFGCQEKGHISRYCPNKSKGDNKGDKKKGRTKPTVKKVWCALQRSNRNNV